MRPRLLLLAALSLAPLWAQEDETPPERPAKPPVALIFTPPGIEGEIVLGIFDAGGRLVRTLRYENGAPELKIDTNGYVAQWDGLDAAGKSCAAGRYSAHGFVVGDEVAVEGEAFHFNDWMAEDRIPAQAVDLCQWSGEIGVRLSTAAGVVMKTLDADGTLRPLPADAWTAPAPGASGWAQGRDETAWMIVEQDGQRVVVQTGKDKTPLRELRVPKDEPQPVEILASPKMDVILLKETGAGAGGLQRVRMLKRGQSQAEKDGRVVADWEVVFERTLQPCANFGVAGGKLVPDAGAPPQADSVTIPLVENPLEPGRKPKLKLTAVATHPGSALAAPGGLVLIGVSTTGDWKRFAIAPAGGGSASLYQGDGVVVEEFRIKSLDHIAGFNAGSFLLAAPAQ